MLKLKLYLLIVVSSILALVASACTEPATTPTPLPPVVTEKANFRFLISDDINAIDDFTSINVTISKIGVQRGGESGNWIEFTPNVTEVDLKPLVGENALEIYSGNLIPGEYSKVFIYVSEVNGILTPTLGGEKANVKLPSEKLQISKPFVITENTTTSFVYDVTVVKAGQSGQYILKPQIARSGADQEFKEVKPQDGKDEKPEDQGDAVEAALEDKIWMLDGYGDPDNLTGILEDTKITAKFASSEGTIDGSAGCNSYFASCQLEGDQLSIPGPIAATEMYCMEPEGVMEQEQEYLTALQLAESYEIDGDELRINCGSQVLIFKSD